MSEENVKSTSLKLTLNANVKVIYRHEDSRFRLSIFRKFAYGTGHIFNDMCASMWFTYLVLFYHKVVLLDNLFAGLLVLIGQLADAAATPIIGFLCDMTHVPYGRRKLWHLIGTVMVAISLFFIWHSCLPCNNSTPLAWTVVYFSVPIIIFQSGWAAVQISHLSLIPELTSNKDERVGLNSIRYASTILSNLVVYVTMLLLLQFVAGRSDSDTTKLTAFNVWAFHDADPSNDTNSQGQINPSDVWIFSGTALGIIFVGILFSIIFQVGVHEPYIPPEQRTAQSEEGRVVKWYQWFTMPQFYMVVVIYMCTRLMSNLTQAYIPLFLIDTLNLPKTSVAIGPLVLFVSGFLMNMLLKLLNKVIGRYMAYFIGLALMAGGLVWFWFTPVSSREVDHYVLYGAMVLTGAGGATVMVTSLSMVADIIGCATGSSAFVYGMMSFTDKLSSGIAIQVIQALHPCKDYPYCCPACKVFYRNVLVFVPGGAVALAFVVLVIIVVYINTKESSSLLLRLKNRILRRVEDEPCITPCINSTPRFSEDRDQSPMNHPAENIDESKNEKRPLLEKLH